MGKTDVLQIWRFTFGQDHKHPGFCQPIYGTYITARRKMFEMYEDKWAFQYSQLEWEAFKNDPRRKYELEQDLELVYAENV